MKFWFTFTTLLISISVAEGAEPIELESLSLLWVIGIGVAMLVSAVVWSLVKALQVKRLVCDAEKAKAVYRQAGGPGQDISEHIGNIVIPISDQGDEPGIITKAFEEDRPTSREEANAAISEIESKVRTGRNTENNVI